MRKASLRGINNITLIDYSSYCPKLCWNGGKYLFKINCDRKDNSWIITHETSADFEYCKIFGDFQNCKDCFYYDKDNDNCTASPTIVSDDEMIAILESAFDDEMVGIVVDGVEIKKVNKCDYCHEKDVCIR